MVFVDISQLGELAHITNEQTERILSANAFFACVLFLLATSEEILVVYYSTVDVLPVRVFLTLADETSKTLIMQIYQEGMLRESLL